MPKPDTPFIHLHTHSHYSLLEGLSKIKSLVKRAKEYGMPALALTDSGNMYGAIEFYQECTNAGIKPIIGIDAYITPGKHNEKQAGVDNVRFRLTLLAKNKEGYQNLMRLTSIAHTQGFYYKPRMDKEMLREYHEGIICLSGGYGSEISRALRENDMEKAEEVAKEYRDIFGVEHYFLEIQHHPNLEHAKDIRNRIIALGKKLGIDVVATQDSYYLDPEDAQAQDVHLAIGQGVDIHHDNRFTMSDEDFSFIDSPTACEYFNDIMEAFENTSKIADMCNLELKLGTWTFPNLVIDGVSSFDDELRRVAYEGIERRGLERTPEIIKRLDYELEVIKNKGFSVYFLIVGDLIRHARKHNIYSTIRGSVAGSMTTYLLGITNVHPFEYKLPFERFLNPERPSAPDIDMDFADNRRDEVLDYARAKYGKEKVAQIGTFGKMLAKGAVRDVARAMGYPYSVGDKIANMIPMGSQGFPMTIDRAIEMEEDLKKAYEKDPSTKEIIDMAKKIEGCARHISVHAAGTVISPTDLTDFVPIQIDPKGGKLITQYDMHGVEDAGLIKFDFLGIRNLAILGDAVRLVKKFRNVDVDIEKIPVDDEKTFKMLARGETVGLFQLNGAGMTQWLKELRPTVIHDINAMVALYRPGPMEMIPDYIKRKYNPRLITYLDPRLKNILDQSYGVITYQDDVMMIAIELAGYSWLEADKLRKAMGKKIPALMEEQKKKLLEGFETHGLSKEKGEKLWTLIEPFAAYGFNKCVTGDTTIVDANTGTRISVEELCKQKNIRTRILSLDANLKLTPEPISAVMQNGIKEVFKLTTRTGRTITATGNHPFRVFGGWKTVDKLFAGERVAVARVIAVPKKPKKIAPYKAATLGYLLSEGNLCHPHGIYFYSKSEDEIEDFIVHARQFKGTSITVDRSKSAASVYVGAGGVKNGNTLMVLIKELGLHNKKATEKFVPEELLSWSNDSLAIFLGKLWQGDGAVSVKNEQLFYATSSLRLARDVQHMLLCFGIISTIHNKLFNYRGEKRPGYTVTVTHRDNIFVFEKTIGRHLIGKKKDALRELADTTRHVLVKNNHPARGTKDIVPAEILEIIRKEMLKQHITTKELARVAGLSERLFGKDSKKKGYQRAVIETIAQTLHSKTLLEHAQSDIYWDEIVSIEPHGKEMTYDLTINPHHNFVANDIIVHNSHAASYGRVAYQTAYMKANYPAEYMTAVLTAESGDVEKIAEIIHECRRMNIPVLSPNINESFGDFTVIKKDDGNDNIRFGLYTIKNFGYDIGDAIIAERDANGKFASFSDFLERIHHKNLNKKSLESLIKAGAMDELGERGQMLGNMEASLEYNKHIVAQKASDQSSLFGEPGSDVSFSSFQLKPSDPATMEAKLGWEKELLGLYISGHPLDAFREKIIQKKATIEFLRKDPREGIVTLVAGVIEECKDILTKKGDKMAFVKLADYEDTLEVVVFPRIFTEFKMLLVPGACVVVKGKLSKRNDELSVIADAIKRLE